MGKEQTLLLWGYLKAEMVRKPSVGASLGFFCVCVAGGSMLDILVTDCGLLGHAFFQGALDWMPPRANTCYDVISPASIISTRKDYTNSPIYRAKWGMLTGVEQLLGQAWRGRDAERAPWLPSRASWELGVFQIHDSVALSIQWYGDFFSGILEVITWRTALIISSIQ